MSEQYPTPSEQGPVEYLGGPHTAEAARKGRGRSGLVAGGAAAVVALGAASAWGIANFMSGGQEAAEVVPADALAYVSLNLDPDGGQKLEAYQTLKKFPALETYLDKSSGGEDLRRSLVEPLLDAADCPGVDFDDDVAPWLGKAVAVAAVPGGDTPEPVAFLQITDEDAAKAGIAALSACDDQDQIDDSNGSGDDDQVGTAFGDGWLVVAESDDKAQGVLDDAANGTLADDAGYQRWVEEAGGPGIVTAYVSPDAPAAAFEAMDTNFAQQEATLGGTLGSDGDAGTDGRKQLDSVKGMLDDFEGGAVVLRFADESLELETAFGGLPDFTAPGGDSGIGDLPDTTAVAYGVAVNDTFVQDLIDAYSEVLGKDQVDQLLTEAEQASGLLPEDLQAVLGDGVAVALDGSADFAGDLSSPASVPFGVRIKGDPAEITPALDKVVAALTQAGVPAGFVSIESGDDAVGLALSPDRATTLAGTGGLGDQAGFTQALPDLDKSGSGLYVGFDDGGWFDSLVSQAHDSDVEANVAPLHSLGITSWSEGSTAHGLAKLTTN